MIVTTIWLMFIETVLHLATILLSLQVEPPDGSNALVSYLASIIIMVINIGKFFILFAIILNVINRF